MLEPLQEPFMQRALAEVVLLGVAGGALGCWVVFYGLSYAAESLAHSIFPGLVLAAIAGVPLLLGAAPAIVLAALAIALCARIAGVSREAAVAVVVTTMFGLGVLLALSPHSPPGIESLLFGDVFGVSDADLATAAGPRRRWSPSRCASSTAGSWSPASIAAPRARSASRRLSPTRPCWSCSRAGIVVAVQGLGNLLVVAVFVGPAAAARRLSDRMLPMMLLAAGLAVFAGVAGLYLSYYAGTAGGASVALAIVAVYLLSLPAGSSARLATPGVRPRSRLRSAEMPTKTDSAWAEHALAALQQAGYRRGGARTAVVEALARHDCAVTALDLDDELRRRKPAVGRASVYRALEQLEQLGLVQRLEVTRGTAGYERVEPGGEHHHHAICRRCGRMVPFEDSSLERAIAKLSERDQLRGHRPRRGPARPLRTLLELI